MSNDLMIVGEGFDKIFSLAEKLSKSGIIPNALRNKPNDIVSILLMGKEMNLPPMMSLQMINVIDGRPELSSQGKLAVIKRNFPEAYIAMGFEGEVAYCTMARSKDSEKTKMTFGPEDAKRAGLNGRATYQKFPKNMYQWRCVGNCARAVFPDIMLGIYSADEIEDITDKTPVYVESTISTPKPALEHAPIPEKKAEIIDPQMVKPCPTEKKWPVFPFGVFRGKAINEVPIEEVRGWISFLAKKEFKFGTWSGDFFKHVAEYIGDGSFLGGSAIKMVDCWMCRRVYNEAHSECDHCGASPADQPPMQEFSTDEIPF